MKSRTSTTAGLGAAVVVAALTPVALPATAAAAATKKYVGTLERTHYSNVQVTITVTGKKIKTIYVSANPQVAAARADGRSIRNRSRFIPSPGVN